jgi:acyl transferase domain-containing protein/acyl carrier protein
MSADAENLTPLKRALFELRDLGARLERAERVRTDPIAIVGVGLRLPGGLSSADEFWDFLLRGDEAITEVPLDRWNVEAFYDAGKDVRGKIVTRFGGFLSHVDEFDARFFGITPREAASMDPQQRLLLETAWEALEHAGQAPDGLIGSPTGVFMGVGSVDYLGAELKFTPVEDIDAYLASGGVASVISGRLSYVLGLQGPSMTVDTACSSSLTAVHLAVQSLRLGECNMALAGGANLLLLPELSINCSRAHMLAPDGRCKTFDSRADGYVRSEGCGVVVLKRLSDAMAARDRVIAVIRGTAVNQDGRSSGLTVPNGAAQEAVIRDALRNAGVRPGDVSYVEAHGTGTALGDPIELRALGNVFRDTRGQHGPLRVGSVKTNVGHLEAAAGVTGLIKVALSISRGVIPPHLHLQEPTPHVDWRELAITVPTTATPWASGSGVRYAGVSSFGFSGTNAHVVVSEPPAEERAVPAASRPVHVLTVSAKSPQALRAAAGRLANHLAVAADDIAEICHTANAGRAHFVERAALTAASAADARTALQELSEGRHHASVVRGTAPARPPEVAFLFAGQGVQDVGMGRQLFETQPAFRRVLVECDELLRPHLEVPLLTVLYPAAGQASPLHEPSFVQPAIFAFEYALAAMWQSWGVQPDYVLGHSLGEDVAACVAGVFTLADGLKMVARRAQLMHRGTEPGAMAAVFASESDVAALIGHFGPAVVVASRNGPEAVVISGRRDELSAATHVLEAAGVKVRALRTTLACHAPLMDPVLDAIEQLARETPMRSPRLGMVSTLTGGVVTAAEVCDPRYWRRHVRETVRFSDALDALHGAGARVLLEIGPNGTLTGMGRRSLKTDDVTWLESLNRDGHDWQHVAETVRTLYVRGVKVNWAAFDGDYASRKVSLPSYPFQRERHWSDAVRPRQRAAPPWTPRGGRLRSSALQDVVFQSEIGLASCPMLRDHRVGNQVIAPGALFVEMALGADPQRPVVMDLNIEAPLIIPQESSRLLQLVLSPEDGGFAIESADAEDDGTPRPWLQHATGRLTASGPAADGGDAIDVTAIRDRARDTTTADQLYGQLAAFDFQMGPRFRAIRVVEHGAGEALGTLDVPEQARQGQWSIHPALFDAAVQTAFCALPRRPDGVPYIFVGCGRVTQRSAVPLTAFSHFVLDQAPQDAADLLSGRLVICDELGNVVLEAADVMFRPLRRGRVRAEDQYVDPRLHEIAWSARPLAIAGDGETVGAIGDTARIVGAIDQVSAALADQCKLREYGVALADVERRATAHIVRALGQLGVSTARGSRVSVALCVSQHGVLDKYRRLLNRLLGMLAADGHLEADGEEWVVRGDLNAGVSLLEPAADLAGAERALTDRCGRELASVLRGETDPLAVLFPGGSTADLEDIYQRSAPARFANGLVSAAVAAVVESLPVGRTLRVLEVGAGTGGTTESILPILPAGRTRYVFTDLSRVFLERAAQKFAAATFVEYRTLDLDADLQAQGFASQQFDLVLGVNVVHATANLRNTLRRLHSLIAPGGLLLMTEAIVPQRWLDVTFGLTEGWWRFEDIDLRVDHPLLDRAAWLGLLASCGFVDGHATPRREATLPETHAVFVSSAEAATSVANAQRWLVLADGKGFGDAIAARLRNRGHAVTIVRNARQAVAAAADDRLDPDDGAAFDQLVAAMTGREGAVSGCINVWPLDSEPLNQLTAAAIESAWEPGCLALLHLVQSLTRANVKAPIWTVTRDALGAGTPEPPTNVAQSTAWGLGRVTAVEHPELWGGLVDIGCADAAVSATRVVNEVLSGDGEDQVAWRDDQRRVARLVKTGRITVSPVTLDAAATFLISGGLGHLGLEIARWLVKQGARHLTLVGRSGLPSRDSWDGEPSHTPVGERIAAVRALEAAGAQIHVAAADVADGAAMTALFAQFGTTLPGLRGIVHAAHSGGTARVNAMTPAELRAMLRPKVTGTMLLYELSAAMPLDFFVMFSSTTGLIGSIALGHYAAANTFLDAFAQARRTSTYPISAVAWGAWQDLQITSADVKRAMDASGLKLMPVADALAAFGRLLNASHPNPVVVDADWTKLKAAYESRRRRPLLSELGGLPSAVTRPSSTAARDAGQLRRTLDAARESDRHTVLVEHVLREAAHVLRVNQHDLDPTQGLFDLGMDSLMSVELRSRLEKSLELKLPATLTFNYPSVRAIAGYLVAQLGDYRGGTAPPARATADNSVPAASAPPGAVALDDLSESELADMLARTLTELR